MNGGNLKRESCSFKRDQDGSDSPSGTGAARHSKLPFLASITAEIW